MVFPRLGVAGRLLGHLDFELAAELEGAADGAAKTDGVPEALGDALDFCGGFVAGDDFALEAGVGVVEGGGLGGEFGDDVLGGVGLGFGVGEEGEGGGGGEGVDVGVDFLDVEEDAGEGGGEVEGGVGGVVGGEDEGVGESGGGEGGIEEELVVDVGGVGGFCLVMVGGGHCGWSCYWN